VQKDCQARNLNRVDAMDHSRWKKLIDWMVIRMVGGWMFLLVLAHPGSPIQRAVKWLLLFNATISASMFVSKRINTAKDMLQFYMATDANC